MRLIQREARIELSRQDVKDLLNCSESSFGVVLPDGMTVFVSIEAEKT